MTKGEIVQAIFALPFYSEETARHFTVIMGGACVLLGLREETDDVDMACDGQYFDDLRAVGYPVLLSRHGREKMHRRAVSGYIAVFPPEGLARFMRNSARYGRLRRGISRVFAPQLFKGLFA